MKRSKTQLLRSLAAVMLLGAGLASCSQADFADNRQGEPLPPGEYPLILNAGGLEVVATPAQKSAPSTRGTVDGDWRGVSEVAVMEAGETVARRYNVIAEANDRTARLFSEDPYYWQSTTETKSITAWHPHTLTPISDWHVWHDQSDYMFYCQSDYILATAELTFNDRTAPMEFKHQTAKIVVNLTAGDESVALGSSFVFLNNIDNVVHFDGTVSRYVIPYCPDDNKYTYYALLTPQTIGTDEAFIVVDINDAAYLWTPAKSKQLQSGMVYTYNIKVTNTGLEVSVNDGIAWGNNGATGSGSVEL